MNSVDFKIFDDENRLLMGQSYFSFHNILQTDRKEEPNEKH